MRFLVQEAGSIHAPSGPGRMHAGNGADPVRSPAGIGPRHAARPRLAAERPTASSTVAS